MLTTCLVVCFASIALVACEPSKQSIPADLQIGDQIVGAIERFRAEHGRYPQSLPELVPTYLPEIKQPRYGQRTWDYVTHPENDTFALYIWGSRPHHDAYGYGTPEKKWEVIENSF